MSNSIVLVGPNTPIVSNEYHSADLIRRWARERLMARRIAKAEAESRAKAIKTLLKQQEHFRKTAAPLAYNTMGNFSQYPRPKTRSLTPIYTYRRTLNTGSPIILTPSNARSITRVKKTKTKSKTRKLKKKN